jgi:hypothetical protein
MTRIVLSVLGIGLFAGILHMGRAWDDDEKALKDKVPSFVLAN